MASAKDIVGKKYKQVGQNEIWEILEFLPGYSKIDAGAPGMCNDYNCKNQFGRKTWFPVEHIQRYIKQGFWVCVE